MMQASAKAVDNRSQQQASPEPAGPKPDFRTWLRTWSQVLIAELLHVLDRRRFGSLR